MATYLQVNKQKLHTNYMQVIEVKIFSAEDVNCRVVLQVRISYYVTQCHTSIELNYLPHKNKINLHCIGSAWQNNQNSSSRDSRALERFGPFSMAYKNLGMLF